jgi:AbrB family looped-hinge helix DNA binding protein
MRLKIECRNCLTGKTVKGILFYDYWYTGLEVNKMSRVTAKYQITIPPEIRKELGIMPGTDIGIAKKGDKYVLILNPVIELKKRWRGRFKDSKTTNEYMNEIRGKIS